MNEQNLRNFTINFGPQHPGMSVRVRSGKAHGEQMFSASPPEADVATDLR
jgi:NADH:ubiquinone oxidoreductase subunit D